MHRFQTSNATNNSLQRIKDVISIFILFYVVTTDVTVNAHQAEFKEWLYILLSLYSMRKCVRDDNVSPLTYTSKGCTIVFDIEKEKGIESLESPCQCASTKCTQCICVDIKF